MLTSLRTLLIEDSQDDAELIVRELRRGGYDVSFQRADSEAGVIAAINNHNWDLIVCDYSMPKFSGIDALKLLRSRGMDTPFIFVSGTIGEDTAVSALKQGAQDYVMKGNLRRLLPAVERELREVKERRERQRLEVQLEQLKRFEAIGRLAGGIAHDFNNVLGVILGWAQIGLDQTPNSSVVHEHFKKIHDQADRASALTKQLLAFARRQILQPRNVSLNNIVSETAPLLRTGLGDSIFLKADLAPDLDITRADPSQLEQVLMNLVWNARDAMPQGGVVILQTQNLEITQEFARAHPYSHPGKYVRLSVSDSGTGMDSATLDRIFEPFFTTKEIGKGTGLGLPTVYGIVKQHDGFLDVYSEPGKGTIFHVYLPTSIGTVDPPLTQPEDSVAGGKETILVAEDNLALRELAQVVLQSSGYQVILASNGREALHLFKANIDDVQLAILDVVMPLLGGPEVYTQMLALKPNLPVIFTTGHSAETASLNSSLEEGALFLQKPYTQQLLNRTIRLALDRTSSKHT
jgi:two-component system, cell cycle sensor histidine kinase and response regulator CckA